MAISVENSLLKTEQRAEQFVRFIQQISADTGSIKEDDLSYHIDNIWRFFCDLQHYWLFDDVPVPNETPDADIGMIGDVGMSTDGTVWQKGITGWTVFSTCSIVEVFIDHTASANDCTLIVDSAAGDIVITLLEPNTLRDGTTIIVKIINLDNSVTILPGGSALFDKVVSSYPATADGEVLKFQSLSSQNCWYII